MGLESGCERHGDRLESLRVTAVPGHGGPCSGALQASCPGLLCALMAVKGKKTAASSMEDGVYKISL